MNLKEEKLYQQYLHDKYCYESVTDKEYLSFEDWREQVNMTKTIYEYLKDHI